VSGYVGKKMTGIGKNLVHLLISAAKLDTSVEFIVYTNYDNHDFINQLKDTGVIVKTYNVSKNKTLGNLIYNTVVFPFLGIIHNVDAVYIANFFPILFTFKPIVVTITDMIEFKVPKKFSRLRMMYRNLIVPRMAHIAKKITTISDCSKKDIAEICNVQEKNIEVIYCGLTINANVQKSERVINEDYLLFVGTVDYPGKNIHGVIKAYEKVRDLNPEQLKLVIVGMPGKDHEVILDMVEKSKYRDDIIMKGYVEDNDLMSLYKWAKIFLFVSFYEGFGLPVLEGMAYRVPVITSTKSSLPEIAGDAAVLCDPDDIDAIKDGIVSLLNNDSLRNHYITKGLENIKRFSWNSSASQFLNVLYSFQSKKNEK
jgi:glycosyltransferase involved in cell wall biosynthesis